MNDKLQVVASRVAALLVGTACTLLLVHYKLDVPPAIREAFEQLIAAGFVGGAAWLTTHFGIAIRLNPMDTVSPTEAKRGRMQKRARKSLKATQERIAKAGAEVPYPTPEGSDDLPQRGYVPSKERGKL